MRLIANRYVKTIEGGELVFFNFSFSTILNLTSLHPELSSIQVEKAAYTSPTRHHKNKELGSKDCFMSLNYSRSSCTWGS